MVTLEFSVLSLASKLAAARKYRQIIITFMTMCCMCECVCYYLPKYASSGVQAIVLDFSFSLTLSCYNTIDETFIVTVKIFRTKSILKHSREIRAHLRMYFVRYSYAAMYVLCHQHKEAESYSPENIELKNLCMCFGVPLSFIQTIKYSQCIFTPL